MRAVFATAVFGLLCFPAQAINRYNVNTMSCADVQSIVASQGAAILRYPSKRTPGLVLYDRYVRHSGFCEPGYYAKVGFVPTRDNPNCRVRHCKSINYDGNFRPGYRF